MGKLKKLPEILQLDLIQIFSGSDAINFMIVHHVYEFNLSGATESRKILIWNNKYNVQNFLIPSPTYLENLNSLCLIELQDHAYQQNYRVI